MAKLTGGKALVRGIIANGVDTIFALPGVQMDHFFNALHDEGNSIRVIHTRHEQATAYMAFGYAESTGKVGAYAVVPGPGFLNTTAALATAYAANTRVLCLAGQIPSHAIGRGFGLLHEIPDQLAIMRGLTKWSARVEHPSDAPGLVAEAFAQLHSGRPRPVGLEAPLDVLARSAEIGAIAKAKLAAPPKLDQDAVEEAAKLLGKARNPMIVVGGGAIHAAAEVIALARMLEAPVISNRTGRGIVDDEEPYGMTAVMGYRLWSKVDVVLGLGTKLQPQRTVWGTDDKLSVIHVEIDPIELRRHGKPAVGIVADGRQAAAALLDAIPRHNRKRASKATAYARHKRAVRKEFGEKFPVQMGYVKALRAALPEDGILVNELTQVGYIAGPMYPVRAPRTLIHSGGYQGTLGCGFAAALGVKVAHPDRPVVSIAGDGGFMYNVQELATAVKHGINLVTVVFSDNAFGNVRRMQTELYGGRVIATDLVNPDFVALAESFGIAGRRADSPEALQAAIGEALKANAPALIEVPMDILPDPWSTIIPTRLRPAK